MALPAVRGRGQGVLLSGSPGLDSTGGGGVSCSGSCRLPWGIRGDQRWGPAGCYTLVTCPALECLPFLGLGWGVPFSLGIPSGCSGRALGTSPSGVACGSQLSKGCRSGLGALVQPSGCYWGGGSCLLVLVTAKSGGGPAEMQASENRSRCKWSQVPHLAWPGL